MEDFGYQKISKNIGLSKFIKKSMMIGATLFSIGCFLYITISAYHYVHNIDEKNIKIIKSPTNPIKVFAKHKKVASKDNKVIYQDILENKKIDNIEKSRIVKTQPAPKPKKLSNISALNKNNNKKEQSKEEVSSIQKPVSTEKIIVFDKNKNSDKKPESVINILGSESDKKRIAEAKAKLYDKKSRSIRVQVAALTSYQSAQISWQKLKRLYPELFLKQNHYIKKADLGKRGVFYRLQIGDFYNQIKAEEFCSKYVLKSNKTNSDCIIVE